MEISLGREQTGTNNFWTKNPFIMAIERIARMTSWTVDMIEWLWEKFKGIQAPRIIMEVWLNSVRTMTIVWMLGWCAINKDLGWWVTLTWNPLEVYASCSNSVEVWNNFERDIKSELSRSVNDTWLNERHKRTLLSAINDWSIPEDIKKDFCLDEITNLEIAYITPYNIFRKLTIHLKVRENEENIQYVTAKLKKWKKIVYEYDLKPRKIWEKEVRTASNF